MGRVLSGITCLVVCCLGCSPSLQPSVVEGEPTQADLPDEEAAEKYLRAVAAEAYKTPETPLDWPALFGPNRTSTVSAGKISPVWGTAGPRELWSTETGTGYGSPVISDNRVVFNYRVENQEVVKCVEAGTGEAIWEHRYPTTFVCDYEYSDGPYSTPLIDGPVVYALGGQGQLFCLDFASGELQWKRELQEDYGLQDDIFSVGCSPGVVDGKLIINVGAKDQDAGIVAFDCKSGATIWESTDHGAAYCSPFAATIHGEGFLFVVTEIGLVSLDPDTGEMDWMVEHRGRAPMSYNSVSPLVHQNKVLVVTGPGPGALCVEVNPDRSYKQLWQDRRVLDCQFNTLMLSGSNVYGFTAAGQGGAQFRCVDMETGDLRWKYSSLLGRGQGLIAGKAIILLGEQGHLASLLVDETSPQILAFTAQPVMESPCYCAPAFAAGRLFLKDETRVACFDLRLSP